MGKVYRVLLIEDDESNAEVIRLHLNKLDIAIELEVIEKEHQLIKQLDHNPPDLIISDYNLPDFTGMDVLKIARKKFPHLPFILVSGYIGEEKAVDAMLEGASDYAMKDNLDRLGPSVKRELLNYEGRKTTEEKLEKSRSWYHVLLEHVNGIIWEADADTFKFHYVSPQSKGILGYTPEQWYGNDNFWRNHIHPDDREETIKFCHHKSQQGENHTFEYRMITAGNEVVWLRDYVTVILTEDGKPDMLRGLMIDITKQKRAERQRDKAYEIAGIGHWEVDVINNELYWSDAVRRLHEVSDDFQPTLEKGINFYKEGSHRDTIKEAVDQSINLGKPYDEELKIVTANGNERWMRVIGEPEMVDGECIRLYGSFQDIHERKISELELARRNRFIEKTLDNLPIGIAVNSTDTRQTILMNKQFSEIYGWPEEDLNSIETFFEKVYPDEKYREKIKTRVLKDIESGDPERMSWKNIHITTKEGEKRIINAKNIPLPDQNQMISTVVDVTAEKEAEKEKISTLERIDDAFFSVNNNWVVTYWNSKAEQVLGKSRKDIINKNLWEVYDDAVKLDFYTQYHKAVEEQVTVHFEEFYPAAKKWFEVNAYPSESGLSVYFRDITERKESSERLKKLNKELEERAAELAASNAELEQFAYVASHDLQEPLRMVSSFLARLEKKYSNQLDDKAHQYIDFAVEGARRMRQIIMDLLNYSRIGQDSFERKTLDLNSMIEEILKLERTAISESGATIECEKLPVIKADKTPIQQVFQNLINNAIKYRRRGTSPEIRIKGTENQTHWKFSVSDNGIGIRGEFQENIFVIFQRLHTQEDYSGTGIGLAVSKKIVEKYGGEIWVESEEGKGSTFHFTIAKQ